MTIGIYMMEFRDGSVYIGQSNNCERRKSEHYESMIAHLHPNKKVRTKFNSYGLPVWTILQECPLEDLNALEIFYIDKYSSYHGTLGLNLNRGGGVTRPTKVRKSFNPVHEKAMAAAQTAQLREVNKDTDRKLWIILSIVAAFLTIGYLIAKC